MGLEEEIQKLTDLFVDNFMIRGEETEDLKEALHRAPDSLIDMIWEKIVDKESAGEMSRQQKEETLYEDIPGYFESGFELLDVAKINLLLQIMNYDPLSTMEVAEAIKDQEEAEDMLEEISGYVTREDWSIPEIMDCLYDWDVTFSSDRAAGKLTEAPSRWLYTIRRWSEGGHSRQELHKENTELQYVTYAEKNKAPKEIEKKVYPNDPYPCGPGKKYRSAVGGNRQGTGAGKEAVMARTVGIGIQDFAKMIDNDYFYIDRTDFLREWWEGGDDVTLITCGVLARGEAVKNLVSMEK